MYALDNVVRDYAWGSTTAIPELLGKPADGTPQAELWIGAYPEAPSRLCAGDPSDSSGSAKDDGPTLADLVASDPDATLGKDVVEALGPRLPFLLKILAVEKPLSLQAHPDRTQAVEGYAAEERDGVPADAAERTYGDGNHKPEMLWALTEFDALCGFRPVEDTLRLLCELDVPGLRDDASSLAAAEIDLGDLVRRWLTLDATQVEIRVAQLRSAADAYEGRFAAEASTLADLAERRPGDGGVLVAALLNRVHLRPGEAVYLAPGNLHAYLHGTGVEIQASSDNVLRGGLTDKHVDVEGLLGILDRRPAPPVIVSPAVTAYGDEFRVPVSDFALTILRPDDGRAYDLPTGLPQLILALEDTVSLRQGGVERKLLQGRSVFVAADEPVVRVTGSGLAVRASVGPPLGRRPDDRAG